MTTAMLRARIRKLEQATGDPGVAGYVFRTAVEAAQAQPRIDRHIQQGRLHVFVAHLWRRSGERLAECRSAVAPEAAQSPEADLLRPPGRPTSTWRDC